MSQVINTNVASLTAQRNLANTSADGLQALNRLSSGLRINSARDDAAGLAISTRFTAQVRGLDVAIRNAGDGISLAQTAEGALGAVSDGLQRIRELALQSANATNSDSDRQALNAETQQLIAEISRVSEQTNFNGRNLLDGTFASSVQIGTNAGETVSFGIAEVTTDTLGGGEGAGVSARGTSTALANGDLIINGIAVGAAVAADDTASVANQGASAIASVEAINRVTEDTGVVAQVNTNTVAGSSQTAAATAGAIVLNGVSISISTGADSNSSNRAAVVNAINASAEQTGVTAVDTGTDTGGVVLEAVDGRNITITEGAGDLTQAATGLQFTVDDTATFEGGFTLTSIDSSAITIDGGDGSGSGDLANSGLVAGEFAGNTAATVSEAVVNVQAADSDGVNTLESGDLVINGVAIGAAETTDDTASDTTANSSLANGSGIATAAAINRASEQSGVRATVNATTVVGGTETTAVGSVTGGVIINGVTTTDFTTTTNAETNRTAAVDAINAISGQTGVVASDNGSSLTLTAADGRNISVAVESDGFGADIGLDSADVDAVGVSADLAGFADGAATTTSTVTLESAGEITVEAGSNAAVGVTGLGFEEGSFGGATNGQFISDLDISTVEGAEAALQAVDNALDTVNAERANLGAIQNRLDSTISSLAINSENLSAARSRILDADFAAETAELSRTQVLQQAGISILAQANAQPQLVLSLLQ